MRAHAKIFISMMTALFASTAMISCSQTSNTQTVPMGGGGAAVSKSALQINGLTEALNDQGVAYSFDNAGYGLAIWYSSTGNGERNLYSVYNPNKNEWSQPQEFSRNTSRPGIASNGSGFTVTFGYNGNVYAQSWSNNAFSTPVKINTISNVDAPVIASDGTGYCLAWRQWDQANTRYDVYASRFTGSSWTTPAALDSTAEQPQNIQIVSGGSGYCITWYEQTTDRTFASVYNGSWSAAQNIGNACAMNNYKVAGNDAGAYAIAFEDVSNGSNSIFGRVFNGSWSGVTELDIGAWNAYTPRIASNGTTFWAIWYQYDGGTYNIYGREYNSSWGITQPINTPGGNAYEPVIASDGTGYCAAWYQHDGTSYKTYASMFIPSTWQAPQILNPSSTVTASGQLIATNGSGYMASWIEDDSGGPAESRYKLYASAYNSGAWGDPTQAGVCAYSFNYFQFLPFTGGYALTYTFNTATIPGIMANVYRNSTWGGGQDIVAGQRHGSCTRPSDIPVLYRAGSDTVAVWRQFDSISNSGMQKIFARVKTGSSWGTTLLITDQSNGTHHVASSGNAVCVTWFEYVSAKGRYVIFAKIYSGGAWGTAAVVDNDTDGYYSYTAYVAGNASSNDFCVTWYQWDGSYYRTYANLHTSTGWSGPVEIDNSGMSHTAQPYHIVPGSNGYCVVFDQNSLTWGTVFNGSSWTSPEQLHSSSFSVSRLTMAGSGDHYAVCLDSSGNVYTNLYDGSSWSGMEEQDRTSSNHAAASTVTGDGYGGFCLAWHEYSDSGYYNIFARLYDGSALSWGDAENIETRGLMDQDYYSYQPRVASDGTGYAVIFRKQDAYASYSLYAGIFDGSDWLGVELLENSIADIESYYYDITSNGSGYGAVWWQYDAAMNLMAYRSVYKNGSWDGAPLSNGEGKAENVEVLWNGSSYASAWFQYDPDDNLIRNIWVNTFK